MKQKLLCLSFALIMVFSLAACGNDSGDKSGASDFESFQKVQENMKNVKDAEFKMDMDMTIPDNEVGNVSMSAKGKQVVKSKDDIEMAMDLKMKAAGAELPGKIYIKDGFTYTDMSGQKTKVSIKDQTAGIMPADSSNLLNISEDMVSDLKVTKEGENTTYSFSFDADKSLDYFKKNAGNAKSMVEAMDSVSFSKFKVTVVADKDDMVKTIDMDCAMDLKVEDTATSMSFKISMEYISVNTGITIDFPDFKDYKEATV